MFKQDGAKWRRVVPSPLPKRIFEITPDQVAARSGTIVICAGGGGIPTMYEPGADRKLVGVEAVIDKDLCSELLARDLEADLLVMATDAEAVFIGVGNSRSQRRSIRPAQPRSRQLQVSRRLDGTEGRCRLPLCHGDGTYRGNRCTGRSAGHRSRLKGTLINSRFENMTWHG